jgi:hypothetical protein
MMHDSTTISVHDTLYDVDIGWRNPMVEVLRSENASRLFWVESGPKTGFVEK